MSLVVYLGLNLFVDIIFLDLDVAAGLSLMAITETFAERVPGATLLRWSITAATPELWHIEAVLTTPASSSSRPV